MFQLCAGRRVRGRIHLGAEVPDGDIIADMLTVSPAYRAGLAGSGKIVDRDIRGAETLRGSRLLRLCLCCRAGPHR